MNSLRYAYLIGDLLLLFPVWLVLFIRRKDLRKEMISLGIIMSFITYFLEYFYFSRDYWRPLFLVGTYAGIEDLLFGFFSVGIAGTIYERIYARKFAKRKNRKNAWAGISVLMILIAMVFFHILTKNFKINSIYSLSFVSYLFGIVIVLFRHDLFQDVLVSGIVFGLFYFLVFLSFDAIFPSFVIERYYLENISGIKLAGFPIEETVWGASMGFAIGPLYEFYKGLGFKNK